MPTPVTSPGDVLAPITAGAAAAATVFSMPARSNALLQVVGTQPWAYSNDGTNYFAVPAGSACMLPILSGQSTNKSYYFKRTGAVDSVLSVLVAG